MAPAIPTLLPSAHCRRAQCAARGLRRHTRLLPDPRRCRRPHTPEPCRSQEIARRLRCPTSSTSGQSKMPSAVSPTSTTLPSFGSPTTNHQQLPADQPMIPRPTALAGWIRLCHQACGRRACPRRSAGNRSCAKHRASARFRRENRQRRDSISSTTGMTNPSVEDRAHTDRGDQTRAVCPMHRGWGQLCISCRARYCGLL